MLQLTRHGAAHASCNCTLIYIAYAVLCEVQYSVKCDMVRILTLTRLVKCLLRRPERELHFPGVDGLSRKIQEVKDFVDERVEALSRKQDSLGDSQDAMKGQLDDVQDGVQQVTHPSMQNQKYKHSTGSTLITIDGSSQM